MLRVQVDSCVKRYAGGKVGVYNDIQLGKYYDKVEKVGWQKPMYC